MPREGGKDERKILEKSIKSFRETINETIEKVMDQNNDMRPEDLPEYYNTDHGPNFK